jgi:hypothetical protein
MRFKIIFQLVLCFKRIILTSTLTKKDESNSGRFCSVGALCRRRKMYLRPTALRSFSIFICSSINEQETAPSGANKQHKELTFVSGKEGDDVCNESRH